MQNLNKHWIWNLKGRTTLPHVKCSHNNYGRISKASCQNVSFYFPMLCFFPCNSSLAFWISPGRLLPSQLRLYCHIIMSLVQKHPLESPYYEMMQQHLLIAIEISDLSSAVPVYVSPATYKSSLFQTLSFPIATTPLSPRNVWPLTFLVIFPFLL